MFPFGLKLYEYMFLLRLFCYGSTQEPLSELGLHCPALHVQYGLDLKPTELTEKSPIHFLWIQPSLSRTVCTLNLVEAIDLYGVTNSVVTGKRELILHL